MTQSVLKQGHKILFIEEGLNKPGISLVLLEALPKLAHLHYKELKQLIEFLQGDQKIMEFAQMLSKRLDIYQGGYDKRICDLRPLGNPSAT